MNNCQNGGCFLIMGLYNANIAATAYRADVFQLLPTTTIHVLLWLLGLSLSSWGEWGGRGNLGRVVGGGWRNSIVRSDLWEEEEGDMRRDQWRENTCWPHSQAFIYLQSWFCQSGNEAHMMSKLIALWWAYTHVHKLTISLSSSDSIINGTLSCFLGLPLLFLLWERRGKWTTSQRAEFRTQKNLKPCKQLHLSKKDPPF